MPFYYGWIIVVIAALGIFFSGPGQTYSISIFIDKYIESFDWSRSFISASYSIATLTAGFALPFIGRKIDYIGHRKMMTIIPVLLGIICFWMSYLSNIIMLFIGFFFLRLLGQGSMTLMPSTLVPKWFINKRGLALSLMSIGGCLSSALIPVLNNYLIINFGVKFTWRTLGILLILIMSPIGWFFVRNEPEDIGLKPDGNGNTFDFKNKIVINDEKSWTLKEAMTTKAFWLILFCMLIPSMINTGLTFHIVSIIEGKGYSSTFAASILSIVAITQFPFTFIAGYSVDKFKVHYIKGINYLLLLLGLIIMAYSKDSIWLIGYGILNGIFIAFDSVSTNVIWPNYFGRKYLGSIRGIAMTAIVIGSSLGPLPLGFAYDFFHGYKEILTLMMIFPLLGSIACFISRPPKYSG
ncbi:MFS transporter [Thermohalobacter berrensis]|uniref:MFS transporter n=2 Tax=Thermohalobacter berrensis TaxID=99594 RepID=A0A419T1U4_9FIRM|nr:MFS transporter [Thermohalobacter berrensis]